MAEDQQGGIRILIDAAGPESVFGLLNEQGWLEYMVSGNAFLEDCQSMVEYLVRDNELSLEELSGVIYAAGPGSTLGLRLAAMFVRSLLKLPQLQHWDCLQYNNLELAAALLVFEGKTLPAEAIGPWRRDRVHRVTIKGSKPLEMQADALHPKELDPCASNLFLLGNRPRNLPTFNEARQIPASSIPGILAQFPELLTPCEYPVPFTAEQPEFARWTAKRHSSG